MKKVKNYILLILICTIAIVASWYIFKEYRENLNKPIFSLVPTTLVEVNYEELENYIADNPTTMIYLSARKGNNISNFEEKFADYLKDNNLNSSIVYFDVNKVDENTLTKMKVNYFSTELLKIELKAFPNILVFEDGKVVDVLYEEEHKISINDVKKLMIKYGELND